MQTDLVDIMTACIDGNLDRIELAIDPRPTVCVVMASGGYPDKYETGDEITFIDGDIPNTYVYHAGTALDDRGRLVTSGGRVLTIVGTAETLKEARDLAYARVGTVKFKNAHYRNDIGDKALKGGRM